MLQCVTKCYKSDKCCYSVLQSVIMVLSVVTNVLNVVIKCYKYYNSGKSCYNVLKSVIKVINVVTVSYKML